MATIEETTSSAEILAGARRIVIKAGSSLLTNAATGMLRRDWLASLTADLAQIRKNGSEFLIVSSGAVALGRRALNLVDGALALEQKQAAAAVGQPILAGAWQAAFSPLGIITAQALLTLEDTEQRRRWLNSRATLDALLTQKAVPVINENDTVATDEIRYGDNDRLAARVAQMSGADVLILLSDIDGLWSADPNRHENARHIPYVAAFNEELMAMAQGPNPQSAMGTGGMVTKLTAAQMASQGGCTVILASGVCDHPVQALKGGARATIFAPALSHADARKNWIAGTVKPVGMLHIDAGAARALAEGASLLPAGMTGCSADFARGDVLAIINEQGIEIGRGMASYNAQDAIQICGLRSEQISARLGYSARAAMIHRDNLVLNLGKITR